MPSGEPKRRLKCGPDSFAGPTIMDCHLERSERPMQLLVAPESIVRREFPVLPRAPVIKFRL